MAKEKAQLPLETDEKYTLIGDFSRRHYFGDFGEIDFNTLTVERCAALMHGGFPYLKEKTDAETDESELTPMAEILVQHVVESVEVLEPVEAKKKKLLDV